MFRRGETVPFAFVAEAERFRSNVTPPPKPRRTAGQMAGSVLFGVTVIAGLVGSLVVGGPALDPGARDHHGRPATPAAADTP